MAAHFLTIRNLQDLVGRDREATRLGAWLGHALGRLEQWSERQSLYRQTVNELSALSQRELDDIGIARCDIHSIARASAAKAQATR